MSDEIWIRDEIESPCKKLCAIHRASGLCVGCYRTGDEIARWSILSPEERRRVMEELPARESLIAKRKGGRKARRTIR
ncbi:MAG: DUF1289 domain-containing protein [Pseudomonadota bacterium]